VSLARQKTHQKTRQIPSNMYVITKPFAQHEIYLVDPVIDEDMNTLMDSHLKQLTNVTKVIYASNLGYTLGERYERAFRWKPRRSAQKTALVVNAKYLKQHFSTFPKEQLNAAFPNQ
jgi:hypothetical protein